MLIQNEEMDGRKTCICCDKPIRGKYAIILNEERDYWLRYGCRREFVMKILESRKGPVVEWVAHSEKLKILDLFSGRKGWTSAMRDRGHYVLTIDNDPDTEPDICMDINDLTIEEIGTDWDIVLASPPCEGFSIASCMVHWSAEEPRVPKTQFADDSLQLVQHTYELIQQINPVYWAMENPRGMLRKVWKEPTLTTYFASWLGGNFETRRPQKPTDLWGEFPESMPWPKPRMWEVARRGAKTGTQGLARDEAAMIPYQLSFTLCIHAEEKLLHNTDLRYNPGGSPPGGCGQNIENWKNRRQGTLDQIFRMLPWVAEERLIANYL